MDKKTALKLMEEHNKKYFGCSIKDATKQQVYQTICYVVKDLLIDKNMEFTKKENDNEDKHIYYMFPSPNLLNQNL